MKISGLYRIERIKIVHLEEGHLCIYSNCTRLEHGCVILESIVYDTYNESLIKKIDR